MNAGHGNESRLEQPYFFLSYAHSAPLAGFQSETADYWVQRFFEDLSEAVCRNAGLDQDTTVGFYDGLLSPGADWNARAVEMLSTVQAFVPLYAPRYFAMSWPGREWACFTERLAHTSEEPRDEPNSHIIPVLWVPLTRATAPPNNAPDALAAIDDIPEYAENGLRALKMLNLYGQYAQVVARLGRKIVETAREQPLRQFGVPALDEVDSAFRLKGREDDFVVAVAAPTRASLPRGRSAASWYERDSTDWRPFGEQEQLRLGDHAESVAERLNFSVAVRDAGAAADEVATKPAIVLIDPWIAAPVDGGESAALHGLRKLYTGRRVRTWALPIFVVNRGDPESQSPKDELISRVRRILADIGVPSAQSTQPGSDVITSMDEFAQLMPALVAEAERRYLRDYLSGADRPGLGGGFAPLDDGVWEQLDDSGT